MLEGLRTVEVTRLTVGDVDFGGGQLHVLGKGKNTKKAIKLFDQCADALQKYLDAGTASSRTTPKSHSLFPDLKTAQIRYRVGKYFKATDLKTPKIIGP